MKTFSEIIRLWKDKRDESHKKNILNRAEQIFQVTEYKHELWFTHNGVLFCPCKMINGEPTDVLFELRTLYYSRNV